MIKTSRKIKVFGTWAVTTQGVECLTEEYAIEKNRLFETDWITHMSEKRKDVCGDIKDFVKALNYARKIFGVKNE